MMLLLISCASSGGEGRTWPIPADSAPTDTAPPAPGCDEGEEPTWLRYTDADADEHGRPDGAYWACDQTLDASVGDDCDDTNPEAHPGAAEPCAGPDLNCDGQIGVAGATDELTWFGDVDGDGFGRAEEGRGCTAPQGALLVGGDCDDADPSVHPGAPDTCEDGLDSDCDGVDEGCPPSDVGLYGATDGADTISVEQEIEVYDLNRDGIDDVVVADEKASFAGESGGGVFAYFGPLDTNRDTLAPDLVWTDGSACVVCGRYMAILEFGDRHALAVSDPNRANLIAYGGSVLLLVDPASGSLDAPTLQVDGEVEIGFFGQGLSAGPDLDGDGVRDFYIAGFTGSGEPSRLVGFPSTATGYLTESDATVRIDDIDNGYDFARTVAAYDSDGDGIEDLAIGGIPNYTIFSLFLGPLPPLQSVSDADATSTTPGCLDSRIISAGDLDGDGLGDAFASADGGSGAAHVVLLPGHEWPATIEDAGWQATGGYRFGEELLMPTPEHLAITYPGGDPGVVFVFAGPWTGVHDAWDSVALRVGTPGVGGFGSDIAATDLNLDGTGDLLIPEDGYGEHGAAWLWKGTPE